jgi:HPt (histidine-containing phosphotransfer) domain-containing protein
MVGMIELGFAAQLAEDLSPEDLRLVLRVFGDDVRRLTGVLEAAMRAGDAAAFRRAAHGLAGAAGAVGAQRLEAACRAAMGGEPALEAAMAAIAARGEAALGDLAQFMAGLDGRA